MSALVRSVFPLVKPLYCVNQLTFNRMASKSAMVLLAPGSEEMEMVISVDVLRRAGVNVTVAGLNDSSPAKCSRDVVILPDKSLCDAVKNGPYDVIVLPGGLKGSESFCAIVKGIRRSDELDPIAISYGEVLRSQLGKGEVCVLPKFDSRSKFSSELGQLLKEQEKSGRLVAAICAAPTALKAHGIGLGKSLTSYPSVKPDLADSYKYSEEKVVIDGNLITSRGPGTAFDFALALAEVLVGKEKACTVAKGMLYPY